MLKTLKFVLNALREAITGRDVEHSCRCPEIGGLPGKAFQCELSKGHSGNHRHFVLFEWCP